MAITHSYVDFGAGNDTTGDGSVGTPWKTLQHAFDTLTRNTTDGNQVNLKAGTAHVNSAALDLTTFVAGGALAAAAPLILRGYTSAANDGGIGEIDCGGATMWVGTYNYIILVELEIHTPGNNILCTLGTYSAVHRCQFHVGASTPTDKRHLVMGYSGLVKGCYFRDAGIGDHRMVYGAYLLNNYFDMGVTGGTYAANVDNLGVFIGNIVLMKLASQRGVYLNSNAVAMYNIVYNTAAGTQPGVLGVGLAFPLGILQNNIICGQSGVGGVALQNGNTGEIGHNAFWNNTTNVNITDQIWFDETANDVTLLADPFTDAANGDFSLTAAAKTALASKGFPISYLGAHAYTVSNLNIGPIQLAASAGGGGGGPVIGSRIIWGLGAV